VRRTEAVLRIAALVLVIVLAFTGRVLRWW
jgi:hypothetical protein